MQARKFKAVVHVGANEQEDMSDEAWIQFLNDTLQAARAGVMLHLEPKTWEPPGGLARDPKPFRRSRRRR